jgi:transketolase
MDREANSRHATSADNFSAIEQASAFGWERYIGRSGRVIGMQTFGTSASLKSLQREYGFTVDNIVAAARDQLALAPQA